MKDNLKGVGIGIIVLGALGWLYAVFNLAALALGMDMMRDFAQQLERDVGAEAARAIVMGSQWIGTILNVLGSSALIFGGLQMMKRRSWGLCVATCFIAMVPCWGCCCLGLPLGAVGLYLLFSNEVKQSFNPGA